MSIRDLIADQCNMPVLQDEVNRLMATLRPVSPSSSSDKPAQEAQGDEVLLINSISKDEE